MQSTQTRVDPKTLNYQELPVDPKNVAEIERQIKAWGGIHTPVEVWMQGNRIMDGFHRTTGAVNLGMPEIPVLIFDCTEEEFWDKRISQAKKHVVVEETRLHAWILEAWKASEFAGTERNQSFVDAIYAIHQGLLGSTKFKISRTYQPLLAWFRNKADMWGRPPVDVAAIILQHEKVFIPQFPEAKAISVEEDLSTEQARKLTKTFPKGTRHPFGKGASKGKMKQYAQEVIKTNLDTSYADWEKRQAEKEEKEKLRKIAYLETAAGLEDTRRRRIENGVSAVQALRIVEHRITDLLGLDLAEILLARPDLTDGVKRFFTKVSELGVKFDRSNVFTIPDNTERLTLLSRIAELERELDIMRRASPPVSVPPSVMALSESQTH